jgi:histidyl-tRNA synthetase
MGIERMLLLLEARAIAPPAPVPDVYAVIPGPQALLVAVPVLEQLRSAGVAVAMHAAGRDAWGSMKSQFKRADGSGARFALIFGDEELARGEVAIKHLRDAATAQRCLPLARAAEWAAELRDA